MSGLHVRIGRAAPHGALEPRYDRESQILAAEAPVAAEWPYGVDVDGRIVFDLAADRTLMNFDLHVGESRWEVDRNVSWPTTGRRGVIIFEPATIMTRSFHLPLKIHADRDRHLVRIEFGEITGASPVYLAERCAALVKEGELAGFVLRLE